MNIVLFLGVVCVASAVGAAFATVVNVNMYPENFQLHVHTGLAAIFFAVFTCIFILLDLADGIDAIKKAQAKQEKEG